MPEALETWSVALIGRLLPRHLEIIYRDQPPFPGRSDGTGSRATTAMAGAHVASSTRWQRPARAHGPPGRSSAATRSTVSRRCTPSLMVRPSSPTSTSMWPERFTNMTNGITPRRWLQPGQPAALAQPDHRRDRQRLAERPGRAAATALNMPITGLPVRLPAASRRANKADLAELIHDRLGIRVDPTTCSMCRSSASTSTSASCSTCCTW